MIIQLQVLIGKMGRGGTDTFTKLWLTICSQIACGPTTGGYNRSDCMRSNYRWVQSVAFLRDYTSKKNVGAHHQVNIVRWGFVQMDATGFQYTSLV